MSTTLRQVLEYFESHQGAVSLPQMARTLGVERATLQNMIDYWVRKGRLRESGAAACASCGSAAGCPFMVALPRTYELVSGGSSPEISPPACGCRSCR
ncbi:MAG: FeoC-like transcriptional regulator [Anaerolineae bacterium]|nr:FeoC-like transcriptional regulator [Anaerolineae bacterium]NUQ04526.1 hypothetical protein [Anaerolineae bacterium]